MMALPSAGGSATGLSATDACGRTLAGDGLQRSTKPNVSQNKPGCGTAEGHSICRFSALAPYLQAVRIAYAHQKDQGYHKRAGTGRSRRPKGLSLLVVPFDLVSEGQPLIPDILISATVMRNAREFCLLETFSRFGSALVSLRH
jgi:hypothetical protein